MSLIKPETDLQHILLNVLMPGRYIGGEFGSISEYVESNFKIGICFPDLYEIGMSNNAIKLLYRGLNNLKGISCERVFTPAQDFESALLSNNIPLYTLENGIPLNELDILGFSIGYELSATNIITVLSTGQIPVLNKDRNGSDPIVIAGGPAITNPVPFGTFLDAVYLGEAENNFYSIIEEIAGLKNMGASRSDILTKISESPYIWTEKKESGVQRSIWHGFNNTSTGTLPVSSIATIQDNGIIEIMRGCPNSCRFCHAASFYRPYRQKELEHIINEVDFLINDCGYNELTLSSLSSGDYFGLDSLIHTLNQKYVNKNISFSLPSLRINSFTLPLLNEVSRVRRSGLTFAIETPVDLWRKSINKEVDPVKIINILREAREMGWKLAKFYFMIGLPGTDRENESEKIIEFIEDVQKKTGMKLNVNVGTFIPKAHTPFQWSSQLKEEESYRDMRDLKYHFKRNGNIKLSYHSPFVSFVEGILSRGDKRVGDLILAAHRDGARLDAWEEHFNMSVWKNVIDSSGWNVENEVTRERNLDEIFPWDKISLGITKPYLKKEYIKALNYETSKICDIPCDHNCGVCTNDTMVDKIDEIPILKETQTAEAELDRENGAYYYLIEFSKIEKAKYLSHLNIMNVFSKVFRRSGFNINYTQGFNPKPKIEFAHPLSLGISSKVEILSIVLGNKISTEDFKKKINKNVPSGIIISKCSLISPGEKNKKRKSLMSLYGGSEYSIKCVTSYDFSHFFNLMIEYLKTECDYDKLFIEIEGKKLHIKIDNNGKKVSNLFFHLEKVIEKNIFYANFTLERTKLYTGKDGQNYFEYFH